MKQVKFQSQTIQILLPTLGTGTGTGTETGN